MIIATSGMKHILLLSRAAPEHRLVQSVIRASVALSLGLGQFGCAP